MVYRNSIMFDRVYADTMPVNFLTNILIGQIYNFD
jgi:hypothetical protein